MLEIHIKPSLQFISLISIIILCTIGIVLYISISYKTMLFALFFVFTYGGYIFWRYGLLTHPNSVKHLFYDKNGWKIGEVSGKIQEIRLSGESTVTSLFCVLRYSILNKHFKYSCLIFKDSISPDMYRRLLMTLHSFKLSG